MQTLSGFVKIHRKLLQWGWYQDHAVKELWLHLILTAAFKQGTYKGKTIYPGQAIIGRQSLAKELDFSEQEIRTALNKLKSTNEITIETTNKFSVVTLTNWEEYQTTEKDATNTVTTTPTNHQPTINQPATNHQPHLKNVKEYKECKEGKEKEKAASAACADYLLGIENLSLREALEGFLEMRELIKAPMTERALMLLVHKLEKLAPGNIHAQVEMLKEATLNNWKSVFPPKSEEKNKPSVFSGGKYDYDEIRRKSREKIRQKIGKESVEV